MTQNTKTPENINYKIENNFNQHTTHNQPMTQINQTSEMTTFIKKEMYYGVYSGNKGNIINPRYTYETVNLFNEEIQTYYCIYVNNRLHKRYILLAEVEEEVKKLIKIWNRVSAKRGHFINGEWKTTKHIYTYDKGHRKGFAMNWNSWCLVKQFMGIHKIPEFSKKMSIINTHTFADTTRKLKLWEANLVCALIGYKHLSQFNPINKFQKCNGDYVKAIKAKLYNLFINARGTPLNINKQNWELLHNIIIGSTTGYNNNNVFYGDICITIVKETILSRMEDNLREPDTSSGFVNIVKVEELGKRFVRYKKYKYLNFPDMRNENEYENCCSMLEFIIKYKYQNYQNETEDRYCIVHRQYNYLDHSEIITDRNAVLIPVKQQVNKFGDLTGKLTFNNEVMDGIVFNNHKPDNKWFEKRVHRYNDKIFWGGTWWEQQEGNNRLNYNTWEQSHNMPAIKNTNILQYGINTEYTTGRHGDTQFRQFCEKVWNDPNNGVKRYFNK